MIILMVLTVASCKTINTRQAAADPGCAPDFSIVHLSGKITEAPANSLWPKKVRIGAKYNFWMVIDNRVQDDRPKNPNEGSYPMNHLPTRYDLQVADVKLSSTDRNPSRFHVTYTITFPERNGKATR